MSTDKSTYVHPLRRARLGAGLSLRELARRARVHYVQLHHGEHGRRLHEDDLRRIAGILGCQPGDLAEVRDVR